MEGEGAGAPAGCGAWLGQVFQPQIVLCNFRAPGRFSPECSLPLLEGDSKTCSQVCWGWIARWLEGVPVEFRREISQGVRVATSPLRLIQNYNELIDLLPFFPTIDPVNSLTQLGFSCCGGEQERGEATPLWVWIGEAWVGFHAS